jgi:uncharacterized phage-associated protein
MFDVRKVANALLDSADRREHSISNMALNKLAYFAHGWHLALFDRPLVDSRFEAWQFGPVHPQLYRQFRVFGDQAITSRATRIDLLTGGDVVVGHDFGEDVFLHIERIVDFYGGMTASRLSTISHEPGAPWDLVWNAAGSTPGMSLNDDVTREYYRAKLKRPS